MNPSTILIQERTVKQPFYRSNTQKPTLEDLRLPGG